MEYKLNSWGPRRSLRSPSFYIFEYGYMMYIRMFPRHNGQNVYAHVGLTKVCVSFIGFIWNQNELTLIVPQKYREDTMKH